MCRKRGKGMEEEIKVGRKGEGERHPGSKDGRKENGKERVGRRMEKKE